MVPIISCVLFVLLHAPPLPEWDPVPAAEAWYVSGKRGQRQLSTKPTHKATGKGKGFRYHTLPDPKALALAVAEQVGSWQPGDAVTAASPASPYHPILTLCIV